MPKGRMGPPLRSFAADAHDCIMVRVLGPTEYKVVARLIRARKRAPSDRHPDRTKRAVVLEAVKYGLASSEHAARLARRPTLTAPARDDVSEPGRDEETGFEIEQKLTKDKRFAALGTLDKTAPYKETAMGNV